MKSRESKPVTRLYKQVVQMVKNPPAVQETWVRSLGQEVPLAKAMATHSGILAWRIPWTEKPGRIQSMGLRKSDMTQRVTTTKSVGGFLFLHTLSSKKIQFLIYVAAVSITCCLAVQLAPMWSYGTWSAWQSPFKSKDRTPHKAERQVEDVEDSQPLEC